MRELIYYFNKKFPDSLKHNTIVIYINSPRREAYIMRYEQVYNRIKELCEERGWSQYRLIKESGIPQSSFYNMMDRESIPQLDMIQRICDGLNITLGDFSRMIEPRRNYPGTIICLLRLLEDSMRITGSGLWHIWMD